MDAGGAMEGVDAAPLQLFVWLGWRRGGPLTLSLLSETTLRQLKSAIYARAPPPQGFDSERLFRHFLRLTRHPSWQRLEAYALEDQTLAALGFGPESRLMADLAERGDGLGLYLPSSSFLPPSLPLQPSSPHPYPYAVEFLIRLPKAIALSSSLVAWVADVRELPSSPRLFMAQLMATVQWEPEAANPSAALLRLLEDGAGGGQQQHQHHHQEQQQPHHDPEQQQAAPELMPGDGSPRWNGLWERTRASVVWRGRLLLDGHHLATATARPDESLRQQWAREKVLDWTDALAREAGLRCGVSEEDAMEEDGRPPRHELQIIAHDGEGSCCALLSEPAWGRLAATELITPVGLDARARADAAAAARVVQLVCHSLSCPHSCIDQVFARLERPAFLPPLATGDLWPAVFRSSTNVFRLPWAPSWDEESLRGVVEAFQVHRRLLWQRDQLKLLARLAAFRCPHVFSSWLASGCSGFCLCPRRQAEPGGASVETACDFVRRLILGHFLHVLPFPIDGLEAAGVRPTACLVRALLDGVHERSSRLQQHRMPTVSDQHFSTNVRSYPLSGLANPETHLQYFPFLGRLLGFALRDRLLVPLPLPTVFFKLLSGSPHVTVELEDLRELDPVLHGRLARMLLPLAEREAEGRVDDWALTYAVRVEAGAGSDGALAQTLELIPLGDNVEVTEANRQEYVRAFVSTRLARAVREQLEAAREGLQDILPLAIVQALSPSELRTAICGEGQEADPMALVSDRWRAHATYEAGYNENSPQIEWLWAFIDEASPETRVKLLRFITGSSRLPAPDGFEGLDPPICIHRVMNTSRLSAAHTCSRCLDLPAYPTAAVLKERLALALEHVDGAFGFE